MVVKLDSAFYSDLDTFFYNCKYRDEGSRYSYGCSNEENETDGQCLDCGCPLLLKVTLYEGNRKDIEKLDEAGLAIDFKKDQEEDGRTEQEYAWGEDTIMCCEEKDISNFSLSHFTTIE